MMFIFLPHAHEGEKQYLGVIPFVTLGIIYSVYVSAIWPLICLTVKPSAAGSAYGIIMSIQSIGLSIGPTIVGALTMDDEGYNKYIWVNTFLGSVAVIALLIAIWLLFINPIYTPSDTSIVHPDENTIDKSKEMENGDPITTEA